jgi:biotin transport system substrate-specific component
MKFSVKHVVLGGVFTALMAVSAFIRIPMPLVPITLQLEVAILAGLLLGPRLAFCSTLLYLLLGLFGLPIFSGGGGFSYVLRPSFGYIIGFCVAALIVGLMAKKAKTYLQLLLATLVGIVVVYAFGVGYYLLLGLFVVRDSLAFGALMINYVLIFLPTDIPLCALVAFLAYRVRPYLTNYFAK